MGINITQRIEKLPHSYKMHSSMCLELKNLVDKVMRIFPDIEDARPGASTGIQTLCLLNKALEKAKLLLQYCSESSKLYMAVTGEAILSRGCKAKKLLEQSLSDIRSMVPIVLANKISQVVQDLRSTVLALESSEEEAGKAVRELMQQSTSSFVSSDEVRDFHYAALKLQISTPEGIVIERRSLKSLFAKLGECEVNKRHILKYLLCLLKKHEKIIWRDHKENSITQLHSVNDSLCASAAEAGCSEENNATLPEQFKCPLSLTVMYDPVMISSGHTFERMWIQKWFDEGNDSCPNSRRTLDDFTMKPNLAMKDQISRWCSKHGLDVQDPTTKTSHNLDFSIASFGSSLYNIPDLSCFSSTDFTSSFSTDSPSYSKMSKGNGYFMPMETIASEAGTEVTDSSHSEMELEPLCELTKLLKIVESGAEHFQEQAVIKLKNLSTSNEICLEMVSLGFVKKLTSFLQQNVFSKQSIIILRNLCNTEKGRVCITETLGCLASIAELLDSNVSEEQENAISILLQLCVEKIEYCNLVVREGVDIYPSLFLICNNGTEEAKVGASELLRALEEVDFNIEEEEEEEEEATTSEVVVTHQTTLSPKKSGLFGLGFSILKKKKK